MREGEGGLCKATVGTTFETIVYALHRIFSRQLLL